MNEKILLVDDDARVVSALQRSLYRSYQIETAGSPQDALTAVGESAFAVVVSDLKMPDMNGTALLAKIKEMAPDTVRILLTGYADIDAAIAAVNEGNIFRLLTKPCPHEVLTRALDDALEQYRLKTSEQELLQNTLMGAVTVLVEILGIVQPAALGRASRVRRYVRHLALALSPENLWQFEAAALLSQIGCISVPNENPNEQPDGDPPSGQEQPAPPSYPEISRRLVAMIPRMETVAEMIGLQRDESNELADLPPAEYFAALGGHMLRVALDFDQLILSGTEPEAALAELKARGSYDPMVLDAFDCDRILLPPEVEPVLTREKRPVYNAAELETFRTITDQVRLALKS